MTKQIPQPMTLELSLKEVDEHAEQLMKSFLDFLVETRKKDIRPTDQQIFETWTFQKLAGIHISILKINAHLNHVTEFVRDMRE